MLPWFKIMLLNLIDTSLKTQFEQTWQSNVNDSSKCTNYRMYKTKHCLETYFDVLSPHFVQTITNFRLCNNYLPVEKGSWLGISRNESICNLCNTNSIGDEFHYLYLFQCNFFNNDRKQFYQLSTVLEISTLLLSVLLCVKLMNCLNYVVF